MRFDNMLPGGSSDTAFEEAACRVSLGHTDLLLRRHSAIVRAWNAKRIEQGRDWIAKQFFTEDNPEGFFLRVTAHEARYIIPTWGRYKHFEEAQVNFCRSMDPMAVAASDA